MSLACLALTTRGEDELDPAAAALRLALSDCSLRALVELDSSAEQTAFPRSSGWWRACCCFPEDEAAPLLLRSETTAGRE